MGNSCTATGFNWRLYDENGLPPNLASVAACKTGSRSGEEISVIIKDIRVRFSLQHLITGFLSITVTVVERRIYRFTDVEAVINSRIFYQKKNKRLPFEFL